jgi:hypothetical protein
MIFIPSATAARAGRDGIIAAATGPANLTYCQ